MRRIEEANKLVARALADEVIEGGDFRYWPEADVETATGNVRFPGASSTGRRNTRG